MKIKFHRRTFGTGIQVDRLEEAILAGLREDQREIEKYRIAVSNAAILSVHTIPDSVELDKDEAKIEEYRQFKQIAETLSSNDPASAWKVYCSVDDEEILPIWIAAYREAHKPLAPKHQLHSKHLEGDDKEAAQDPNSPLVSSIAPGK